MLCAALLAIVLGAPHPAAAPVFAVDTGIQVTVRPAVVLIEEVAGRRSVSFDLSVKNAGADTTELVEVLLTVRDGTGRPVLQRLVNENGIIASIETIPHRVIPPGATQTFFNPIHEFLEGTPLDTLIYDLRFRALGNGTERVVRARVSPTVYVTKTHLRLPVDGPLLAYDNHDFYSHHRRFDLGHPIATVLGVTGNSGRYAYDLSIVDAEGRMFRGDGSRNEDWYSWGATVHATGGGRVAAMANDQPDLLIGQTSFQPPPPPFDPILFAGNYVVIDHENGEFSLLAHMQKGSVRVRKGDRVKSGDALGLVGFSGSVITVHTHYQLQRDAGFSGEGLPSYFEQFDRLRGARRVAVTRGSVETGEYVQHQGRVPAAAPRQ
jgi:hypothetical protein